jgi:hypothetical protein
MIVIDVLGVGRAADRTDTPLLGQQLIEISLTDPVAPPQVVLTRATATLALPRALWQGLQ